MTYPSRILRDSLSYVPAAVVPALIALVSSAVFTRVFPPLKYGAFALVLSMTGPLVTILSECFSQSIGRFYAEYARRECDVELRRLAVTVSLWVSLVVLGATVILLGIRVVALGLVAIPIQALCFGSLLVIVQSVSAVCLPILSSSLRVVAYRRSILFSSALSLIFNLVLVFVFARDIWMLILGQALASGITLPYIWKQAELFGLRPFWRITASTRNTLRRLVAYGLPMTIWFFASGLISSEDRYVLAAFKGNWDVGVYSVSYNIAGGISSLLATPVMIAVGPVLYKAWAQHEDGWIRQAMMRSTELYMILGVILTGVMWVCGPDVLRIISGRNFWAGYPIIPVIILGKTIMGASNIGHKSLELQERTKIMFVNSLIAAAVNLALNLLLVPTYGIEGSAYSTLVSYGVYAYVTWLQARNGLPWTIRPLRLVPYVIFAFLAGMAARDVVMLVGKESPVISVTLGFLTFIPIYGFFVYLFMRKPFGELLKAGDLK